MKSILTELTEKVDEALIIYNKTIEPIVGSVSKMVNDGTFEKGTIANIYDMWDLNYRSNILPPENVNNSWADMAEYDDLCRHIKAMKVSGYPDCNNVRPIKELKTKSTTEIENKFKFAEETKTLKKYTYTVSGRTIDVPIAENLEDIPSCFYYFKGSKKYKRGVYMSPYEGVIMQVPSVVVAPYSVENSSHRTMKCTQGAQCKNYKCTYTHPGMDYVKIGCVSRCPKSHSFGDKNSLSNDIQLVDIENIRLVSMYGLNDLFSAALWFEHKLKNADQGIRILTNLELCDNYEDDEFINLT